MTKNKQTNTSSQFHPPDDFLVTRYSVATLGGIVGHDAGQTRVLTHHPNETGQLIALLESADPDTVYLSLEVLVVLSADAAVQGKILDSEEGCLALKILSAPVQTPPDFPRPVFKILKNLCLSTHPSFEVEKVLARFPDLLVLCMGGFSYREFFLSVRTLSLPTPQFLLNILCNRGQSCQ